MQWLLKSDKKVFITGNGNRLDWFGKQMDFPVAQLPCICQGIVLCFQSLFQKILKLLLCSHKHISYISLHFKSLHLNTSDCRKLKIYRIFKENFILTYSLSVLICIVLWFVGILVSLIIWSCLFYAWYGLNR